MLRVPNVQNILGVTFAAALINVSTAVIGAQIGVEYAFSPEDYGYYILAWVVFIFTMLWYVHQVWRLEKLRRLHMSMIWSDAYPPETPKDCDAVAGGDGVGEGRSSTITVSINDA